jgi:crotonobetainyl-CoA:carnitine CoA-transferase CaiB-like acyl-CoA transferase
VTAQILDHIKVVDFTHIFSGPLATQILGDMGADVVKVERRGGGDSARMYGQADEDAPMGGSFLALNRNKRSLAVDLSQEEGRDVVRRLVAEADVLVHNFRVGLLKRWGLDYETLSARHPGLIYCSISGFGHTGAMATRAANDLVIQAYSGLMSFTGEPGGPPVRCGTAISDFSAGLFAAVGILGALAHRDRTGEGQEVQTSMLESQVSLMNYFFVDYWSKGIVPRPMGTANRLGIPNQAFPTSDGWFVVSSANESMWRRCCAGLGVPALADDERFSNLGRRYANAEALVGEISAVTSRMTTAECLKGLEEQGVSCAPINTIEQVARDPQLADDLGAFIEVPRGDGGSTTVVASPLHYSRTPLTVSHGVPVVGQHTRQILAELHYSAEDIRRLETSGVI